MINKLIPSEQRATIISIDSMLYSFFMICIFPVCGFLADKLSLNLVFFILGILQFLLMAIVFLRKKHFKRWE